MQSNFSIEADGPDGYRLRFTGSAECSLVFRPNGRVEGVWRSLRLGSDTVLRARPDRWLSRQAIERYVPPSQQAIVIRVLAAVVRQASRYEPGFWHLRLRGSANEWLGGTGSLSWTDLDALSRRRQFRDELMNLRTVSDASADALISAIEVFRQVE